MTDAVKVRKKAVGSASGFVGEGIDRLRRELEVINEELAMLERRYGVSSEVFTESLKGVREWVLPEGCEPDAVEWEALLKQRERIKEGIKELEKHR